MLNLTSVKTIKELLMRHGARPSKLMGQNFLIDRRVMLKIIESAQLSHNDTVLEVGPGIGNLTQELAKRAKQVIAVEKDKKMMEILKETLKGYQNIEITNKDILKLSITNYPTHNAMHSVAGGQLSSYKIVANIPYYLTSPLIRKFLESDRPPREMILMVQKEVAQRICSKPPNMSLLAVSIQFYADPKIVSYVKKESFWPRPKVDSAILKIVHRMQKSSIRKSFYELMTFDGTNKIGREKFFKIVKAGFAQPRKQLANNLSKALKKDRSQISKWLIANGINPEQRAETLSLSNWKDLTRTFDIVN